MQSKPQVDQAVAGREALVNWRGSDSGDWYRDNPALQAMVRRWGPQDDAEIDQRLGEFARHVANSEALVHRVSHDPHTPVLERFDALGRRHERVRFDEAYHQWGQRVYGSGVMAITGQKGRAVEQAALVMLAAHHGEAGHVCPLACTAGMIKAIQQVGHPALQRALLPGLLNPDYRQRLHGAQFLTEIQGGCDVGANAVRAEPVRAQSEGEPGLWAIHGEKWFCSVIDAPLYVLTARPEGASAGTRGLGLFLVPHDLPGAEVQAAPLSHRVGETPNPVNHFAIRRLKPKLGTRAMASGEVDWQGALAWQLGELDRGFHNTVEIILNTSRLFNAMACVGMFWRSFREAAGFARHRTAFGQPIAGFALVDQAVSQLYAEACAASASTFDLVALEEAGTHPAAARIGLNMNKYWTSVRATQAIRQAMEVLGGNAAIEDFTPLGRLYRDSLVTESWEGTHNVLAAQTFRDMAKLRLHEAWLDWLEARADRLASDATNRLQELLQVRLIALRADARQLLGAAQADPGIATRVWMENAMALHQALCLTEMSTEDGPFPAAVPAQLLELFPHRAAPILRGWYPGQA